MRGPSLATARKGREEAKAYPNVPHQPDKMPTSGAAKSTQAPIDEAKKLNPKEIEPWERLALYQKSAPFRMLVSPSPSLLLKSL